MKKLILLVLAIALVVPAQAEAKKKPHRTVPPGCTHRAKSGKCERTGRVCTYWTKKKGHKYVKHRAKFCDRKPGKQVVVVHDIVYVPQPVPTPTPVAPCNCPAPEPPGNEYPPDKDKPHGKPHGDKGGCK